MLSRLPTAAHAAALRRTAALGWKRGVAVSAASAATAAPRVAAAAPCRALASAAAPAAATTSWRLLAAAAAAAGAALALAASTGVVATEQASPAGSGASADAGARGGHVHSGAGAGSAPDASGAQPPAESFRSAQPFSDPDHPGVTLLVAEQVEELVWRRDRPNTISQLPRELAKYLTPPPTQGGAGAAAATSSSAGSSPASASASAPAPQFLPYSVLLSAYDPSCAACGTQKHVLLALAAALQNEPSVRLMRYDTQANYKEGFLSEEELLSMPLVKFFPALPPTGAKGKDAPISEQARQGITYTGEPNARGLLDFIVAHAPAHVAPVDKASVLAALEESAAATDKALREAAQERLRSDPVFHLYQGSPCGEAMMGWMGHVLLSPYLSAPPSQEEKQQLFATFQSCMRTKDRQMKKYWQLLAEVAQDNLDKYDSPAQMPQQQPTPAEQTQPGQPQGQPEQSQGQASAPKDGRQ